MRKTLLAAFAVAGFSSAAMAQDATREPAPLTRDGAPQTYRYQDETPPPAAEDGGRDERDERNARSDQRADAASAWQRRDLFCRNDAAARTGYRGAETAASEAAYGDAYRGCMERAQDDDARDFDRGPRTAYGPPVYYPAYPGPYYAPYPRYYGPSFGFSFGFGPSYRGYYGPPRRGLARPGPGPRPGRR